VAHSKSQAAERPHNNPRSQRKLRRSGSMARTADIKRRDNPETAAGQDRLTSIILQLIISYNKVQLTGGLQPELSSDISGKGQDTPMEDDDDFEPPRNLAEALQYLQAIKERVAELSRKPELTPKEREFLETYSDPSAPSGPTPAAPSPSVRSVPLTREQHIEEFKAAARMAQQIHEDYLKVEPHLTPADHQAAEQAMRDLERLLGAPIFPRPKPN